MPVRDLQDARDVDAALGRVLDADSLSSAQRELRTLFVELLDFEPETGSVPLAGVRDLGDGTRIARRGGVHVVAVQVPERKRVLKQRLDAAVKEIGRTLAGDVLLLATDADRSQWHLVYPSRQAGRDVLRRMVVHAGQPRRTVVEQLRDLYRDLAAGADVRAALDQAYNVEAVTKRFFKEYRRVFDAVMGLVQGLPDEEERKLFCQTLFNRLMFLYFLQRKGWLTFKGDAAYLEALWRHHQKTRPTDPRAAHFNFYGGTLRDLFFAALSNPSDEARAARALRATVGEVPYLNGGLFAEEALDRRPGVEVPDHAIGLILHDLFARFNFTVAESTPFDVEVAVDPEMLGKVFEELVTGRHESGSYYTPRPIVAFMCREALKGYLASEVAGLSAEAADAFVHDHIVRGLTMQQASAILDALGRVTAVDPACGSGAYLLGLLHELVDLQRLLYSSDLVLDNASLYELKLRVIERNVYGVDIDPFAINVAMLRLWLSLVIDWEGDGYPPALPNLDFKIVRGDSLSAPDPNPALQSELFRELARTDATELARLKAEFMRATAAEKERAWTLSPTPYSDAESYGQAGPVAPCIPLHARTLSHSPGGVAFARVGGHFPVPVYPAKPATAARRTSWRPCHRLKPRCQGLTARRWVPRNLWPCGGVD